MNTEPTAPARRISAANLTVPKKAPAAANLFERLRDLADSFGPKPNKNDAVTALIVACIGEGLNSDKTIMEVLARLGFNTRHVAMMLKHGTGATPASGHWRRNADKTYSPLT